MGQEEQDVLLDEVIKQANEDDVIDDAEMEQIDATAGMIADDQLAQFPQLHPRIAAARRLQLMARGLEDRIERQIVTSPQAVNMFNLRIIEARKAAAEELRLYSARPEAKRVPRTIPGRILSYLGAVFDA